MLQPSPRVANRVIVAFVANRLAANVTCVHVEPDL